MSSEYEPLEILVAPKTWKKATTVAIQFVTEASIVLFIITAAAAAHSGIIEMSLPKQHIAQSVFFGALGLVMAAVGGYLQMRWSV